MGSNTIHLFCLNNSQADAVHVHVSQPHKPECDSFSLLVYRTFPILSVQGRVFSGTGLLFRLDVRSILLFFCQRAWVSSYCFYHILPTLWFFPWVQRSQIPGKAFQHGSNLFSPFPFGFQAKDMQGNISISSSNFPNLLARAEATMKRDHGRY